MSTLAVDFGASPVDSEGDNSGNDFIKGLDLALMDRDGFIITPRTFTGRHHMHMGSGR